MRAHLRDRRRYVPHVVPRAGAHPTPARRGRMNTHVATPFVRRLNLEIEADGPRDTSPHQPAHTPSSMSATLCLRHTTRAGRSGPSTLTSPRFKART